MPRYEDVTWSGIEFSQERFDRIMAVNRDEAIVEAEDQDKLFTKFGRRMPAALEREWRNLLHNLFAGEFGQTGASGR